MTGKEIIAAVRKELKNLARPEREEKLKRFFKEEIKLYGVEMHLVDKMAGVYFKEVKPLGKKAAFALCEELMRSGYSEEFSIAADWAYRFNKEYTPEDFPAFQHWVQTYVSNWAACDGLCNHAVGTLVEMFPQFLVNLKEWAHSDSRWVKRAAAVTLIIPARRGKFLKDVFEIADTLLLDKDDLVQKGYGWMLKEAAKQHEEEVFNYIIKNKKTMPRTALRYAIEKMPGDLKKRAMAKN